MALLTSLSNDLVDFLANIPAFQLTAGTNLFEGELPQGVTNAVLIIPAPSPAPHEYIDNDNIIIDFWTIYDNTPAGYDMARQIKDQLHRKANYTLNNWYIYSSLAVSDILDVDRTEEGSKQHKISFLFTCRSLANVS